MTAFPGLAAGRWHTLSLVEQLANAGSEVDRALRARAASQDDRFARALDRALELFDLTVADPRWAGPRRREILRAREEFCGACFAAGAEAAPSAAGLSAWFLHFSVAARRAT